MKKTFGVLALLLTAVLILSCASKPSARAPEVTEPEPAVTEPEPEAEWPPMEEPPADEEFFSPFWPPVEESYGYEEPAGDLILDGAQTHLVVWGDSLTKLAKRYYGSENGYFFPLILLASRDVVSNPDVLLPETRLTIPDLQRNLDNPASRRRLKEYINEVANMYDSGYGNRWDIQTRDELRSLANSL